MDPIQLTQPGGMSIKDWAAVLGPVGVILAIAVAILWRKLVALDAERKAREDALTMRLQRTEDDMRDLQKTVIRENTEAITKNTAALATLCETLEGLPCAAQSAPRAAQSR